MSGKLPSFQFYPGDWMKDPNLKVCQLSARGLLIDLLCVMFESKHRGRLCYPDGITPLTDSQVVGMVCGSTEAEKLESLKELERHEVLKRDEHGCLYSARMVRDESIRAAKIRAGAAGGEAKASKLASKPPSKIVAQPLANTIAKTGSSSSSSSSDINTESASALSSARPTSLIEVTTYGQEIGLPPAECERFHDHFTANGWRQGGRAAMKDWRAALRNWKRRAGEFGGGGSPASSSGEIDWDAKARRMASMAKEAKYQ